jgi:hypothetical protein
MGTIFVLCWLTQSISGWAAYNSEQLGQREDPIDLGQLLGTADFWNRILQNWQPELLAVGSFDVIAVSCGNAARPSPSRWRRTRRHGDQRVSAVRASRGPSGGRSSQVRPG